MTTFLLFALGFALTVIGVVFGIFNSLGEKAGQAGRSILFNYGPGVILPKSKPSRFHYYVLGGAAVCIIAAIVRLFT